MSGCAIVFGQLFDFHNEQSFNLLIHVYVINLYPIPVFNDILHLDLFFRSSDNRKMVIERYFLDQSLASFPFTKVVLYKANKRLMLIKIAFFIFMPREEERENTALPS